MYVFGVILLCIFQHSDWIPRDTEYLSLFGPNAGKCGPDENSNTDSFYAVKIAILALYKKAIYQSLHVFEKLRNVILFPKKKVQTFNQW